MDGGRVVEEGTPAELARAGGWFERTFFAPREGREGSDAS